MTADRDGQSRAWVSISRDALAHNISLLQTRFGRGGQSRIMAVVKADAYGHDVSLIAPVCAESGITDFGVATVDEGIRLRELVPPASAIYILAPTLPEDAPALVRHCLIPLVSDYELGHAVSDAAQTQHTVTPVHLDVDTGIGRAGAAVNEAAALLRELDSLPGIKVTGLATHFAAADEDADDAHAQFAAFANFARSLGTRAHTLLIHASNSPAALIISEAPHFGMVRPGLLIYGIEPASRMFMEAELNLRPVLLLQARVILCRPLPGGASISYGRTYIVPPGGGIYATIGIGYGDGWPRRFGNGVGHVLLRGQRAPICGRVCMDQFVVDVSRIPGIAAGDIATLIGTDGTETITAAHLAGIIGTTPHEITTCLTARLPRLLTD